ncbi:UNVERIFIED_CONTAM: hypothetical protein FKN15_066353 [Acipenser sinensis]
MYFQLGVLLVLALGTVQCQKRPVKDEWDYRDGADKVNMRGVANLTEVLDNWRFDILNQMKNLVQNDHQALLPDYSRISPLSEALDDLFNEFNALKERLGDLSEKFVGMETFIEEVKDGKVPSGGARAAAPPKKKVIPKKRNP